MSCQGCRRVQLVSQAEEFSIPKDGHLSPATTVDSPRKFRAETCPAEKIRQYRAVPLDDTALLAHGLIDSSCKRASKSNKIGLKTKSVAQPPITLAEINSRGILLEKGEIVYSLPTEAVTSEFEYRNSNFGPVKCKFEKGRSLYEIKGKTNTVYYSTSKNSKMLVISKD